MQVTQNTSKNPFIKTQINSAFEKSADAEKIHKNLTDRIINTISQVSDQGSILQLLIGAPGSGKTHLLSRLWKISVQGQEKSFLFVAVPPPGDISRINLHILREIISSLLEKYTDDKKELLPLDLFITEILRKILIETLPEEQEVIKDKIKSSKPEALFHLLTKSENRSVFINHSINNFSAIFPNIDVQLSQALFALLDPFRKFYILKWFQGGELTESEKKTLNIGSKYIDESLALTLSKAIINLSPFPIILTVDQLESSYYRFKRDGLIKLVDNTLALLQEKKNLFLLLVVQTQEWIDNIRSILPRYILDRISKIHPIKPLTLKEGYDLANLRLEKFQLTTESIFLQQKQYYPFSNDFIANVYKTAGGNPRQVLNLLRDGFEYAEEHLFSPEWEKDFEILYETKDDIQFDSSDIFDFYDQIIERESHIQSKVLETIPLEKLNEIIKGFTVQLIKECFSIIHLEKLPEEAIKLNYVENELIFDIVINEPRIGSWVGIIIANQKNLVQFQKTLEAIVEFANFQEIIILRSQKLENVDVTQGIKQAISNLKFNNKIDFIYLPHNFEVNLLASKHLIDNSKDIVFNKSMVSHTTDLVIWYLINRFINMNPFIRLIYDQLSIHKVISRTDKRIKRLALFNENRIQSKIKHWQELIKLQDMVIVNVTYDEGFEFGLLFSFNQDDNTNWGLFRGSGLINLSSFIEKFIEQIKIDWDPLTVFVFSGRKNITELVNQPISFIIAEYGHGIHLSVEDESIDDTIEYSVLALIKMLKSIYDQIPAKSSMTPEKLKQQAGLEEIPTILLGTIAQVIGPLLNVTFRNGQIYSASKSDYSSMIETVTERGIKDDMYISAEIEEKDALDLAEERGEIQRIWDDNVIELTSRIEKFNLFIDPSSYEILTAILNYAKISPDGLTPLIRGLVTEFRSSSKHEQISLSLEDIEKQILKFYKPFKDQWALLKVMPPLISLLGTNLQLVGFTLNAFTLLDFHSIEIDQNWHELISNSTKAFINSNLAIQQLSESYYTSKFEHETKTTLLPIVNKYQSLIIDETNLIEANEDLNSSKRDNLYITLARHISEWWLILESFNRIVGYEFHLDNKPFMDEIFDRYEARFKGKKINYISTDPLTFTIFFDNAFELMSIDSEKLLQIHQIRSELSFIQAQVYDMLLEKKYRDNSSAIFDELSFWRMFYYLQSTDSSYAINSAKNVITTLIDEPNIMFPDVLSNYNALIQIASPNIIFDPTANNQAEKTFLAYILAIILRKTIPDEEIKDLIHMFDMLLLLPVRNSSQKSEFRLNPIETKKIFPFNIPLCNSYDKKIKVQQSMNFSIGSKLLLGLTKKLIQRSLQGVGLGLLEDKTTKTGNIKLSFRGEINNDNRIDLSINLENGKKGTFIQLEFKMDKKNEIQNDIAYVILSSIIIEILLEPEFKALSDRAFIINCALCGYQINLIKNKDQNIAFPCLKCGTQNILHPNVYKVVKDFIK